MLYCRISRLLSDWSEGIFHALKVPEKNWLTQWFNPPPASCTRICHWQCLSLGSKSSTWIEWKIVKYIMMHPDSWMWTSHLGLVHATLRDGRPYQQVPGGHLRARSSWNGNSLGFGPLALGWTGGSKNHSLHQCGLGWVEIVQRFTESCIGIGIGDHDVILEVVLPNNEYAKWAFQRVDCTWLTLSKRFSNIEENFSEV